jgi:hypothetical protein
MTARPAIVQAVKLTTQLTRGDLLKVDGLGSFAVLRPEPYGSQALIKLGWENLAIIAPRDAIWTVTSPADPIRIHGYQPCQACRGTGLIFGSHPQEHLRRDHGTRRWRTAS